MQRILSSQLAEYVGQEVLIQGWLHQIRALGEVNFVLVRDRAGITQAVVSATELSPLNDLAVESVIELCGTVVAEPQAPSGYELHHVVFHVLSGIPEPPPIELNKKRIKVAMPTFLEHAVLGHRHPQHKAVLRLSSGVMQGFRQTLNQLDFTEIQTPKLVGSATESGANVYAVEHFGQTAYLAQSPQFYKQIMVGVFERVYEVGPVFRAEKHATSRHINEYVSLDVEIGFIEDHVDVMRLLTTVITGILDYLTAHHAAELALLGVPMPVYTLDPATTTFPHIEFSEAQELLAAQYGVTDAIGAPDFTPEHERIMGRWAYETHQSDYLLVTGYPTAKRAFYTAPNPQNPAYSNSFDLLFRGTELVSGGQRLHRYEDYLRVAAERGYDPANFSTYFEAFKYGMPKHGGFAIGLERFIMQLLKLDNIRMATLFPRDIHRLTP